MNAHLELHLPTLAEAQAALETHALQCPGSYLECFGDLKKETARQCWIERQWELKTSLEMAQRIASSGWRAVPVPVPAPEEEIPMSVKKTDGEKLQTMLTHLDQLMADKRYRLASHLRSRIRAHCELCDLPCPTLPSNPNGGKVAQAARHETQALRQVSSRLKLDPEKVQAAAKEASFPAPEPQVEAMDPAARLENTKREIRLLRATIDKLCFGEVL